MRASRLLTILITLQLRGRTTAQALADQLEVSKRTIYRDIDELSAAGVPIYADRGRAGGLALLDGFRTELTGLTVGETEALLLAGVPAAAADLGLTGEASAVRIKLLASMPREASENARRVADRFYLDPHDWYRRPQAPECLRIAARCVWEGRRLWILYESWKKRSETEIEPLGLILKAGHGYMLANGRKPRAYKLDNVIEARALEATFVRSDPLDLAALWRENVRCFEESLAQIPAVLRVAPSASDRLYRLGDIIANACREAPADEKGWRQAEVRIESISHAAGLLLGFGAEVEVIDPPELREALLRRAEAVVGLYGRPQ